MDDSKESIDRDVAAVGQISAVPSMLRIICENTGMGFAAVARVTDGTWTACAVQDNIQFGLLPGGQLEIQTTLCSEARAAKRPVVIDHASQDATYRNHHTPRIYGIESYVSVPIVMQNGDYFGNLCAIDPRPASVSDERTLGMFTSFAALIAQQLESEEQIRVKESLRRAAETALNDERATAELREQFIAVLGHDLRNPLAAVDATAELLSRRAEADIARIGQRLRASSRRMSGLINDVLDFARGRLGAGIGIEMGDASALTSALRDVVAESRAAHPDRVLVDHIDIAQTVRCDVGRVQQLLSNLIGNALTYGAVTEPVRVDAAIDGAWLVIGVANGGLPISPANLTKVFEPFWRPSTSTLGGGLGLGLHICSQIVKAHGGTMEVTSSAEAGTRFVARFPVGQSSA
jgi:signal transduction histidine kinase